MKKKMTKKKALQILEREYGDYDGDFKIEALCCNAPRGLRKDWCNYWDRICQGHSLISGPFYSNFYEATEISLTRLLMLHCFVEDTYR